MKTNEDGMRGSSVTRPLVLIHSGSCLYILQLKTPITYIEVSCFRALTRIFVFDPFFQSEDLQDLRDEDSLRREESP